MGGITRMNQDTRTWVFDPVVPGAFQPILTNISLYNASSGAPQATINSGNYPIINSFGQAIPSLAYGLSYSAAQTLGVNFGILFGAQQDSMMAGGYTTSYFTYYRPGAYVYRRQGSTVTCSFILRLPRCLSATQADSFNLSYGFSSMASGGGVTANVRTILANGNHITGTPGTFNMQETATTGSTAGGVSGTFAGDAEYPGFITIDGTGVLSLSLGPLSITTGMGYVFTNGARAGNFWLALSHGTASAPQNLAGIRNVRITVA